MKRAKQCTSIAAFMLVAILVLAGCVSAPTPDGAPTRVGTVKFGVSEIPPSMHPNSSFLTLSQYGFYAFADALTDVSQNGEVRPALALQWQSVSPTSWEFKLRPGVKFHNGDPFTANDVKFSYEEVLNPENKLLQLTRIGTLASVQVVDELTVRFTTKAPDPIWPGRASVIRIVPAAYVARVGGEEFAKSPIGTGPFKVREFIPNQHVFFDASDGSWRGKPKVKSVEALLVREPAALVSGLQSGQFNLIKDPPFEQRQVLKSQGFAVASTPSWNVYLLEFNQSAIFADSRVRQAFNYAVDKETIVSKIFFGYASVAPGQMVGAGAFGYNPNVKAFPYDPAKAKSLLDEAGWKVDPGTGIRMKDGKQLEITAEYAAADAFNPGEGASTQAVAQYLSEVGVKVRLLASERGAYLPRLGGAEARHELSHGGWRTQPIPDAEFGYVNFSCTGVGQARYKVCDPANVRFEELFAAQRSQLDISQRGKTLEQLAQFVHERPIGIYMVQPHNTWLFRGVSNVTTMPNELTIFDNLVVGQ